MGKINCNDEMLFEKTVDSKTVFEGHVFDVEIKKIITSLKKPKRRLLKLKKRSEQKISKLKKMLNLSLPKRKKSP